MPFARAAGCRAFGRLDPEAGDATGFHILQQIAVIGGDLDDMRLRAEPEARDHVRDIALGMRQPALREGGEIGVAFGEEGFAAGEILRLDEEAFAADTDDQRIPEFRLGQIGLRQIGIRRWRRSEIEEGSEMRAPAMPAFHGSNPSKPEPMRGSASSRGERLITGSGH